MHHTLHSAWRTRAVLFTRLAYCRVSRPPNRKIVILCDAHEQRLCTRRLVHQHLSRRAQREDQPATGQTTPGIAFLKVLQRLAKWVIAAAAVASLVLAFLPTALSTPKGLQAATAIGSRLLPGTLHVDNADLGWRKPVKISGITLQAPANLGGENLASIASLSTNARLWDIARFKAFDIIVSSPQIDCTLSSSGKLKWAQLIDHESGKAPASGQSNGKGQVGAASTQDAPLITETTDLGVTGEARLATASIYVSDGTLRVPQEVKEVIGQDLHLVAVVGSRNIEESSEEFSLRAEAGSGTPQNQAASTSTTARAIGDVEPAVIVVRSEHLDFELAGWTQRNGRLRLRQAATAQLQFTPALAKYGLARISPLLSGILAVEEGVVQLTVTTPDMHIPSESYHVRIDPLRVAVNRQDLLAKSIEFLRLRESQEVEHKALLQGATSALHVDLDEVGGIRSKRLDLLISSGRNRKGVHLCTWGEINPVTNSMDVALGVPADTLAMIGLKGLPESEMLVIPVRGSTAAPRVDWVQAYKRLAALAADHGKEPTSLSGRILQGIVQGLDLRANAPGLAEPQKAPRPIEKLPWDSDQLLLKRDVEVDSSTVTGS